MIKEEDICEEEEDDDESQLREGEKDVILG